MHKPSFLLCFLLILSAKSGFSQTVECRVDTMNYYEYFPGSQLKFLTNRLINSYNPNNLLAQQISQSYIQATNTFLSTQIMNYHYDENERLIERTTVQWSTSLNAWVGNQKLTYEFSSTPPNRIESQYFWSQGLDTWVGTQRYHKTFDANGNDIEGLVQQYNFSLNQWVNHSSYVVTYDANNNNLGGITQSWNSATSSWVNNLRSTRSYNPQNNIILEVYENWDVNSNTWKNSQKISYTYNAEQKITERLVENWNANLSLWINHQRRIYSYLPGNTEVNTFYVWDINSSFWVNSTRGTDVYNEYGNQIEDFNEVWVDSSNSWVNSNLTYNFYNSDQFRIARETNYSWNPAFGYYENRNLEEFICTPVEIMAVENISQAEDVILFPNPLPQGEALTIKSPAEQHYKLINGYGTVMLSGKLFAGLNSLYLDDLPVGLYVIQMNTKTIKFIKN